MSTGPLLDDGRGVGRTRGHDAQFAAVPVNVVAMPAASSLPLAWPAAPSSLTSSVGRYKEGREAIADAIKIVEDSVPDGNGRVLKPV